MILSILCLFILYTIVSLIYCTIIKYMIKVKIKYLLKIPLFSYIIINYKKYYNKFRNNIFISYY